MPRQRRLIVPNVAAHVIQRGNNRMACFRQESDYLLYLAHLRKLADELRCAVHAYCLMTNHVHLLVTPSGADTCTVLMRDLGQRYVQYFNRRYERSGTLWEGRFRSCVAESAAYVLACYRYIELNPVLAGMVATPAQYRWSSYAANAQGKGDSLLRSHPAYDGLGLDAERRSRAYREMCDEGVPALLVEEIRKATRVGCVIGTRRRQRGRPPKAK